MRTLNKTVIYLLILTVPMSVWADLGLGCNMPQTTVLTVGTSIAHDHSSMNMNLPKSQEVMLHGASWCFMVLQKFPLTWNVVTIVLLFAQPSLLV